MGVALIVGVAAGIVGPIFVYIATVRRLSGRVGTSEAEDLWEESRSIREWATGRINELNTVVARLEQKVQELEKRNDELYRENGHLTRTIERHEKTIEDLRSQVDRLAEENERLRNENVTLRSRMTELEASDGG